MITGSDTSQSLQGLNNLPAELQSVIPTTLVANHPNAPLNTINQGFPIGSTDVIAPQTIVNAVVSAASDGATVYAVPAGKTFYCVGIVYYNTDNAAIHGLQIKANGTVVWYSYADENAAGHNAIAQTVSSIGPIFTCPGGTNVTANGTGGTNNNVTIWGWIQ